MKKTIFFDLMGTLGGDPMGDYTMFEWYPWAKKTIALIKAHGDQCVIITNQSRIGKGIVSYEGYHQWKEAFINDLLDDGLTIDGIYCCPHTRDDGCICKKPKVGMIDMAKNDMTINSEKSYIIGDMGISDMALAHSVGMKGILVLTGAGQGSLTEYRDLWKEIQPYHVANNCYEAVCWIYEEDR